MKMPSPKAVLTSKTKSTQALFWGFWDSHHPTWGFCLSPAVEYGQVYPPWTQQRRCCCEIFGCLFVVSGNMYCLLPPQDCLSLYLGLLTNMCKGFLHRFFWWTWRSKVKVRELSATPRYVDIDCLSTAPCKLRKWTRDEISQHLCLPFYGWQKQLRVPKGACNARRNTKIKQYQSHFIFSINRWVRYIIYLLQKIKTSFKLKPWSRKMSSHSSNVVSYGLLILIQGLSSINGASLATGFSGFQLRRSWHFQLDGKLKSNL